MGGAPDSVEYAHGDAGRPAPAPRRRQAGASAGRRVAGAIRRENGLVRQAGWMWLWGAVLRVSHLVHIFAPSTYRVRARIRRGIITKRVPLQRIACGHFAERPRSPNGTGLARGRFASPSAADLPPQSSPALRRTRSASRVVAASPVANALHGRASRTAVSRGRVARRWRVLRADRAMDAPSPR